MEPFEPRDNPAMPFGRLLARFVASLSLALTILLLALAALWAWVVGDFSGNDLARRLSIGAIPFASVSALLWVLDWRRDRPQPRVPPARVRRS